MADDFWESAAQQDPLWAILSDPTKRGRQWDLASFFESGRREISLLDARLRELGRVPRRGRALDFGCGVGRLTQALAPAFDEVVGVDASPTMVHLARELNRHPGRARYVLNAAPALAPIESNSVDFLYTNIVLQHLVPARTIRYVADFMRVLAPGGIAVFQLPSRKRPPSEVPARPAGWRPDAYRAELRIVAGPPPVMTAGTTAVVRIDVRNTSGLPWVGTRDDVIRAGNHWRRANGEMVVQDDARAAVPGDIDGAFEVELVVKAPAEPGEYRCEFDLAHEGVTWFADRGSMTVSAAVSVAGREGDTPIAAPVTNAPEPVTYPDVYALLPAAASGPAGEFPMFGVSRTIVTELIRACGCELFQVDDDERAGPEWESHIYFVAKPR